MAKIGNVELDAEDIKTMAFLLKTLTDIFMVSRRKRITVDQLSDVIANERIRQKALELQRNTEENDQAMLDYLNA